MIPSVTTQSLSRAQARRIGLAAQGFLDPPVARPTLRTLERTVARTGVLQVDSVNVLQRAHLMPLYARMGPYDTDLLRRASTGTARSPRRLVEYWAHVQALMPVELWPAMRHRMRDYQVKGSHWGFTADHGITREVLEVVRGRGPVTARDLETEFESGPRSKEHWGWNWSQARQSLDFLYRCGELAIAGRNSQFEVSYDVAQRVIPARHFEAPELSAEDARVELVRRAARSYGVATTADLRDYYRITRLSDTQRAVDRLVEGGELHPVVVEGWRRPAYLHHQARLPRRVSARTLLSPFDPVVWHRERTEALFDFHYRIEIYVPAAKRQFGYYCLPFLLGDTVVGRVDLKADRRHGRLLVPAAYAEPAAPADTATHLAWELRRLADWLGLAQIVVQPRGDLAPALGAAVGGLGLAG